MPEVNEGGGPGRVSRSKLERRLALLAGLILATSSFVFQLALERRFDERSAFEQNDVLFDADPWTRLESFGYGRTGKPRTYVVHPVLSNFVTPVVSVTAGLLASTSLTGRPEEELRRQLGLLVAPAAAAFKVLLLTWLLWSTGLSLGHVVLLTLVGAASFSELVFGSVPDHWMLSGAALVLAHLLLVDCVRRGGEVRWGPWIAVGVLATAITVTNAVIVCLLAAVARAVLRRSVAEPLRRAALLGIAIGVVTAALAAALGLTLRYEKRPRPAPPRIETPAGPAAPAPIPDPGLAGRHFVPPSAIPAKLLHYPAALVDTFASGTVRAGPFKFPIPSGAPHSEMVTLAGETAWSATRIASWALVALALGLGAWGWLGRGRAGRAVAGACLAVLLLNGLLHAVYGSEYFLYTQHWHATELLLAAGAVLPGARTRKPGTAVLVLLLAVSALVNARALESILSLLSG